MTGAVDLPSRAEPGYGHARNAAGYWEGTAVRFHALVCDADPRWDVPTISHDPAEVFGQLRDGEAPGALPDDVTHLLLVGRAESGPDLRRLATLLRAHTPGLHVGVLESDQMPLALAAVTAHVLHLGLEPGQAARETRRLLEEETDSGLWVRRPGKVEGARPGMWSVVRSWFTKEGCLARGAEPVRITRADADGWASVFEDSVTFLSCGELPPPQAAQVEPLLTRSESWSRDASPGARQVAGRQRAVEFAALRWTTAATGPAGGSSCDSCGASVAEFCAYCHAHWGRAVDPAGTASSRPDTVEGTA